MSDWSRRQLLAAAGGTLAIAGCTAFPDGQDDAGTSTDGAAGTGTSTDEAAGADGGPYADVYDRTIGSVVTVRAYGGTQRSTGSGFVRGDGTIVTNHHVVEGADEIELAFGGGEWATASVLGTDVYADLAALDADERPEYATPLSMLEAVPPIGTRVMALGNPFGYEASASTGIVSGTDRSLEGPNNFPIPDAVQTDAAVNPGNSGGPLVTLDGDVVGVITAGGGDDIGFAISAPLTERVVPALVEDGSYAHPYLGAQLLTVTPAVATANDLQLDEPRGVLVAEVVDGGPADGALRGSPDGTRVRGNAVPVGGDVVLSVDGTATPTLEQLTSFLALETSPGEAVGVEVLRDGDRTTIEVTLGERPPP